MVPFLDMRSYALAVLLGNLALAAYALALRRDSARWRNTGFALYTLAILTNESAFVLLPLLPGLALLLGVRPGRWWRWFRGPVVLTVLAVVARLLVLGELGGYGANRLATVTEAGKGVLLKGDEVSRVQVFAQMWEYTFFPSLGGMDGVAFLADRGIWVAAIVAAYLVFRVVLQPFKDRSLAVLHFFALWFVGYVALWTITGAWFWRLGYPMVTPLALVVAALGSDAWTRCRPAAALLHSLAPAALITGWAVVSPLVHPPGPKWIQAKATVAMGLLVDELEQLEGPGRVYVVLPFKRDYARRVALWSQYQVGPEIDVRLLAVAKPEQGHEMSVSIAEDEGRAELGFGGDAMLWTPEQPILQRVEYEPDVATRPRKGAASSLFLDTLYEEGVRTWFVWVQGDGSHGAVEVPAPGG